MSATEETDKKQLEFIGSLIANAIFNVAKKLKIETSKIRIKINIKENTPNEIVVNILSETDFIKTSSLKDILSNNYMLMPMIPVIKDNIVNQIYEFAKERKRDVYSVDMRIALKLNKVKDEYELLISFFEDNKFVKVLQ